MEKYSPWHDVDPTCENENYINCVIEIAVGSKRKFEVATNEDFNSIKPDMKDGKVR
jgi:inorganic pyrophosphatase